VRLEVRNAHAAWERASALARTIPPELDERLAAGLERLREAYARGALPLATALASSREALAARRALAEARAEALSTSYALARASGGGLDLGAAEGRP
jgi:outer membrane protein TolC